MKSVLTAGTTLHGKMDYTISRCLGQGGFGITYLATGMLKIDNITHEIPFTIKEFYIEGSCQRMSNGEIVVNRGSEESVEEHKKVFLSEAERLHKLKPHNGIVSVNEVFRQNNTIYYVMKYLGNVTLTKYISDKGGTLDEEEATTIFVSVAKALQHLHNERITHLDVKPDNIMMEDNSNPVLIDFGLAVHYGKKGDPTRENKMICCSDGYSPLEQYLGITSFSQEADIYALGATLLYMLTGKTPPKANDINDAYFEGNLPENLSQKLRDILRKCMAKLSEHRFHSIEEILSQLDSVATVEVDDGEDKTRVIGVREYKHKPKVDMPKVNVNWKRIGMIVGGVIVVALLGFGISKIDFSSNEDTDKVVNDTTAIEKKDTTSISTDNNKNNEEKQETVAKPVDSETKGGTEVKETSKKEVVAKPEPVQKETSKTDVVESGEGTIDLGYATYTGKLRNGKPHGRGTLVYKTRHSVGTSDKMAESGEKVTGSFISGSLSQGKLYRNDGSVETVQCGI